MDKIDELLTRRVQQILPTREVLEKRLRSGQKIRVYQGFDPSNPNLHIGHLIGLLQLKTLQELGHEVIFLIGDFTGMIGDPSDKTSARQKLSREQVVENAKTYKDQASHILRFEGDNPAQIKFNSEWLDKLTFAELIELSSNFTIQQFIERDMFQDRLKNNRPIFLHEFLYPLMVTYDAIQMEVDLELGGNDQLFNMSVGRPLVQATTGKDKCVMTVKLLTDGEGRKIGKTTGNAINLFGDAKELYGAIMSQPDSAIIPAFELATTLPMEEVKTLKELALSNPMQAKKRLAYEIVKLVQGEVKAITAQAYFEGVFQKKDHQTDMETLTIPKSELMPLELLELAHLGVSNSDRKRMMRDGAVQINDQKITDPTAILHLSDGDIIKYGKHQYLKIKLN